MKSVNVSVDIFCYWTGDPQAYRIYVDDDLLTERTYHWDNSEYFITEFIVLDVEPGQHKFKIEPVTPGFDGFSYRNFHIDGILSPTDAGHFIID